MSHGAFYFALFQKCKTSDVFAEGSIRVGEAPRSQHILSQREGVAVTSGLRENLGSQGDDEC